MIAPLETKVQKKVENSSHREVGPVNLPTGGLPTKITKTTKTVDSSLAFLVVSVGEGAIDLSHFFHSKRGENL
jgi:hypothetical protein